MVSKASLNQRIPPDLNGHSHFGHGETIIAERTTSQQRFNNSGSINSKFRLNDQLEKLINIAIPKQHPYSSHISKFAMFPSLRSPNNHKTGVAHNITVLSKTKGGPYRHEVLERPIKTSKKAVTWTGEHRSLDQTKPLKGETQVFHHSPPKMVLPNPKTRDWDWSLSERTSNMLKNLERSHWVTSYQMHHTGSGPANPLMMDDFREKICDLTGMNSHAVPLRERSFPAFVPSKRREGCRRGQRESCSPTAPELPNQSQAPNQCSPPAASSPEPPLETRLPSGKHLPELCAGHLSTTRQPSAVKELTSTGSNTKLSPRAAPEQERAKGGKPPGSTSDPSILPRPPVLPGSRPVRRVGSEGRDGAALCLLQNSFSKSKAHREFNCCNTPAAVDLRDNVVTGKKHDFYGINCYHLHG
ncbi:sperm-associated microtubule inner protein 4 isoform 1-T3 [Spinachia spinachia]